ncbi:hypothetical protein PVMG_04590 [Plasmodium vivax Mauritania I]|uniref:Uncharacterized protein n=1 Tax=Plasmodium vivax Mauritania I TaxID=1035515 RepID=A0A0J9T2X5_PLAVI|nr:hypothetical protein PVMG_04590 [Plasmodium vivax Mauritania I]
MINLCKTHAENENDGKETYNDLCMKLLRNLLLLLTRYRNDYGRYIKRCYDLYNWLYHETKSYDLTENIIPSIFYLSYSLIQETDQQNICPYELYKKDDYKHEKIIELNIFGDNIETLSDILKNRTSDHYCPCIKYVKNCVKTYKYLEKNYCTSTKEKTHGNLEFCKKLNNFTTHYGFLTKEETIKNEIPSLSSDIDTYTNKCLSDENMNQLSATTDNGLVNSTPVAASTVVGAMVGIPPFLALMYKVNIILIQIYEQYLKYMIIFPCSIK